MIYKKLKHVSTHGYAYIPNFRKEFPELRKIKDEELSERFRRLNIKFYTEQKKATPFWIRLTLPFALVLLLLMIIGLPLKFILTGNWNYPIDKSMFLYNWFRALKIY